ncbi:hypothetical protein PYW08_013401 [Mythimna loreyi]|uniref:Uncharacterized protein n=1 Tax=Mythimna loreyi TaxID=667449 RepID=A0ACC2QG23_9NEOP|nr:hypothetical protein PYW08_013401 [Mythimna loreyi]
MVHVSAGCWYSVFLDAYTYSTNYLLFAITVIIASIVIVWIYEKPKFYKLIFKRSKHSNIISPIESNEELETNYSASLLDEISNNLELKKIPEVDQESESYY